MNHQLVSVFMKARQIYYISAVNSVQVKLATQQIAEQAIPFHPSEPELGLG